MSEKPRRTVSVVMQRRTAQSRWADWVWEPWGVLSSAEKPGEPRLLVEEAGMAQWLHPGFTLVLHRDEMEGYYLNVSAPQPRVFVLWRMENEMALPIDVTLSSEEAARWADGGHSVDSVPIPPEIFAWVGAHVEANYRPEPQKRFKSRSFQHPKDRA
jgi:hypothetical protein